MHANQKTVRVATPDEPGAHHPVVATLLALVDDLAYRIRSLDADYDECLVYQRAIAISSQAKLAARFDASNAHAALRDLLLQLESVGIYLPGNDAGQWASAEGLSFSALEAAMTASGLVDKNDDSHWTMEADSTSIRGETSWSVMSGDNTIADFYGPKARDRALLLVTARYEADLPRRGAPGEQRSTKLGGHTLGQHAMKTSQDNFHPALGHVADGCQVAMASGDTLELRACMASWRVTLVGTGQVLGTFPHAASVRDFVVHYDRSAKQAA